jgi:hypothetical protein
VIRFVHAGGPMPTQALSEPINHFADSACWIAVGANAAYVRFRPFG